MKADERPAHMRVSLLRQVSAGRLLAVIRLAAAVSCIRSAVVLLQHVGPTLPNLPADTGRRPPELSSAKPGRRWLVAVRGGVENVTKVGWRLRVDTDW